jgi:hypothetical protein
MNKDRVQQQKKLPNLLKLETLIWLGVKMGRPGFEPGTNRLKAEYSTVELATRRGVPF